MKFLVRFAFPLQTLCLGKFLFLIMNQNAHEQKSHLALAW